MDQLSCLWATPRPSPTHPSVRSSVLRNFRRRADLFSAGQVKLENIGFTVPAGLIGLESLATNPTLIKSVDVVGGTPDAILLNIRVGLTNPSNLDLTMGNLTLQLFAGDNFLGTAVLPDLHLTTGYQVSSLASRRAPLLRRPRANSLPP